MINKTPDLQINLRNQELTFVGGSENYAWINFADLQILLTADQLSEIVKLYTLNREWINSQKVGA